MTWSVELVKLQAQDSSFNLLSTRFNTHELRTGLAKLCLGPNLKKTVDKFEKKLQAPLNISLNI